MRTSARAVSTGTGADPFVLTLLPAMTAQPARARDVVFVVDRSGSMGGWKMIAARRSVARMVDSLRAHDRFCVIAFDDRIDVCPELGDRLTEASDRNRFRATEWLASVNDRGGTEMAAPLARAADLLADRSAGLERDRVLVFVTDGQVGNEAQLMKLLGKRLAGARVFALGIDQAVNAGFLNRLAGLGGQGEAELVESEDRVDEILTRCHRRIDAPILRDLQVRVEGGSLAADTLTPSRLPDVFDGVPAIIAGKVARSGACTIVVTGVDRQGGAFSARVPVEASANPAIGPAWGRLHLRDLEDRYDGHQGDRAALAKQIIKVSLETKVLCRFTAFVAVDHEVVNEGGRLHKTTQSVESPAGWGEMDKEKAEVAIPQSATRSAPAKKRMQAPAPEAQGLADDDSVDYDLSVSASVPMAPPPPSAAPSPARAKASGVLFSKDLMAEAKVASAGGPGASRADEAESDEPMMAPAEPAPKGGLLGRAIGAARSIASSKTKKADSAPKPAPAAPMSSTTTSDLSAYAERVRDLVAKLEADRGAAAVVVDALRLLVEEAAHAGVPPATRKPLDEAIAALLRGDVDEALRLLRPIATTTSAGGRRGGSFWG